MGDREAQRVLDALEAYLAGVDTARAVRKAFKAGVAVGRRLGPTKLSTGELSTLSTGYPLPKVLPSDETKPLAPLRDPPTPPRPRQYNSSSSLDLLPVEDPDLRSIECASAGARETLALFSLAPRDPRPKPRARLPEDFCLTAALRAFAEAGGLDAAQEFAAFKDHYRATGECRADWPASFREWCRRTRHFDERANGRRELR